MQLQLAGGIGGHNLLVVLDPQGNIIKELDGLATGSNGQPTTIGLLPWTTRLQVWDNVRLEKVPNSQGQLPPPGQWFTYYSKDEPQAVVYSGTEADVMNRWDAALDCMAKINALNLYYPAIGIGTNSDSVISTEDPCMGLTEPAIPGEALLVPGRGTQILSDQVIGPILQQHNITPTATDSAPSIKSENGQKDPDGSFTLTTLFTDGSRDVETDSTGGAQEVLYAASGQIMTDATINDATSSLAVDQYLNPGSDAILTETFPLDCAGRHRRRPRGRLSGGRADLQRRPDGRAIRLRVRRNANQQLESGGPDRGQGAARASSPPHSITSRTSRPPCSTRPLPRPTAWTAC